MAELGERKTSNAAMVIRILLIVLLLYVAARELFPGVLYPPREPGAVREVRGFLEEVRGLAVSEERAWKVVVHAKDGEIVAYPSNEEGAETPARSFAVSGGTRILNSTFGKTPMEFTAEGSALPGGEIMIQDRWKRTHALEVSPKSGEVWLRGADERAYFRLGAWAGALCIAAIFSFLYKENEFYRFFEHLLVGIAVGYGTAMVVKQNIWDKWWVPMKNGFAQLFGTSHVLLVFAGALFLLYAGIAAIWLVRSSGQNKSGGVPLIAVASGVSLLAGGGMLIRAIVISNLEGGAWYFPLWGHATLWLGLFGLGWCAFGAKRAPLGTQLVAGGMSILLAAYGLWMIVLAVNGDPRSVAFLYAALGVIGVALLLGAIWYASGNSQASSIMAILGTASVIGGIIGFFGPVKESYDQQALKGALLVFAGLLGSLWYFQYSKRYLWMSRLVVGVTAGAAAGLGIKNTIIRDWPQITGTFKDIFLRAEYAPHMTDKERYIASFENFLILFIVLCVLYYFFFSFRRKSSPSKAPASAGRMFLMVTLGAFFGNTFLTRVVILIDRVQFLLRDWLFVR